MYKYIGLGLTYTRSTCRPVVAQENLNRWGAHADPKLLTKWKNTMQGAHEKGFSGAKVQAHTTAVLAFIKILKRLGMSVDSLRTQSPEHATWDPDTILKHETLLAIYVAEVTQTQQRACTAKTYARNVTKSWKNMFHTTLWPEYMFEGEIKTTIKGLERIKQFITRQREGFSAADVAILIKTLREWGRSNKRIGKTRNHWDQRLVASMVALITFCFNKLYRVGDATCSEREQWDPRDRFSRASVSYSEHIEGVPREVTLDPPANKVSNKYTGHPISGQFSEESINWASTLDHLIAVDPVAEHLKHKTPLFRDTRGINMCGKAKDGTFEAGGKPLSVSFVRETLKNLVKANKVWFGDRAAEDFGAHSLRIGAMNAALDAGASYFEICALGRWCSEAVLDYHRMPKAKAHEWQRRSAANSFEASIKGMREAGVSEKLVQRRINMLAAARSNEEREHTTRRAVARPANITGYAMAVRAESQTRIPDSWRRSAKRQRRS